MGKCTKMLVSSFLVLHVIYEKVKSRTALIMIFLWSLGFVENSNATIYYVSNSGSDDNPGTQSEPWLTIQKAANSVGPGDTVLVQSGVYPEHVKTRRGGTSESNRIVFRADGVVTMQGFEISHPYITIDGFDITGYTTGYGAHIKIESDGDYCEIKNNVIRDGARNVNGIVFGDADNCIVRNNVIRNLRYIFLSTFGGNHLFEGNKFERLNNWDFIRVFGHNHIFRRNIFTNGNSVAGETNHPDWIQTFGDNGTESINMLFEENWVQDLEGQLGQLNSGSPKTGLQDNIHTFTFRKNVFINTTANFNISLPNVTLENNTFYRFSTALSGLVIGGSLTRGNVPNVVLKNNVFLEGGTPENVKIAGFYGFGGIGLTSEVLVYKGSLESDIASKAISDLCKNGYLVNANGGLTDKARDLNSVDELVITDSSLLPYKDTIFNLLYQTSVLDKTARSTFYADYNYVAGPADQGFPAKNNSSCDKGSSDIYYSVYSPDYHPFNFCEKNGINGGDPKFQNIADPLGPDGIPFTSDDGLIPSMDSFLCKKGKDGVTIGAYECASVEPEDVKEWGDVEIDADKVDILDIPDACDGCGNEESITDLSVIDIRVADDLNLPDVCDVCGNEESITDLSVIDIKVADDLNLGERESNGCACSLIE